MSMYRQLWLAIIVSTLLALGGSLFASILSARGYLQSQLSIKNADNASALALSLSHSNPDDVSVELAVSALFDSGHYELIRVVDPLGKTIVEQSAPLGETSEEGDAPAWFVRQLPIQAVPGQAQISDGWKQYGTVTLVSHSRFAYGALWNTVWRMIGALAVAGLVGGYLGMLILRRLKRPLTAVVQQASAIAERRFITIDEPKVPELRRLAAAMNAMVSRLKSMFEEEAARLETVRREANCDALTGLANRRNFMERLHDAAHNERSAGGTLLIARLANLAEINQQLGRSATDALLSNFGTILNQLAAAHHEALGARLNGADFAMLVPQMTAPEKLAETLLQQLSHEASRYLPEQTTVWLGGGYFDRGIEPGALLAQVDAALATAETQGRNNLQLVDLRADHEAPKSADEWAATIERALKENWVRLVSFPVIASDGSLMHRECPLRLMFDAGGDWQPAGRFLPVAERLKLTPQLDLVAVKLGLAELVSHPTLPGLAINLSASSIQLPEFRQQLLALLSKHRHSGTQRLWLEVAEAGALTCFDAFRALCLEVKDTGCQMGIEHFGRQFSEIGRLHDLGLDYLKVDASFIRGLESNPGNQSFLKGLSSIAHGIGMKVIAEGVTSTAEMHALQAVGFDGATGPIVQEPV